MGSWFSKTLALSALCLASAAHAGIEAKPTLRLAAEERYDDDALLRTEAGAGQLMTKVSPQAGLTLLDTNLTLKSWYALDLLIRHGSGTTGLDHRGEVESEQKVSRTFTLKERVQVWRVSDPTSLPRLGLARTLSPILYGKASLSATKDFTARLEGTLGYRFEGAQVYEPGALPGFTHAPYAQTWYHVTRRTDLGMEYRYQLFTYGPERSNAHGAFASYRYRLTRQATFTAQAGPVFYLGDDGRQGLLPKATLELTREGPQLDVALVAGQDLVGASGFTSSVWADFASLAATFRFTERVRTFAAASYYRNGRAPNAGALPWPNTGGLATTQGYAFGGGVEWRVVKQAVVQGTFDRISQLGAVDAAGLGLVRNIAAVRLVVEPL